MNICVTDIYVILSKGLRFGLDVVVKIEYRRPINFTLLKKKSKKIVRYNVLKF